jgi:hypothetical protein
MAPHNQASSLVVGHNPDESERPLAESALRISEIELVKTVNIWRIEEAPVRRGVVVLRRTIGGTASEKKH